MKGKKNKKAVGRAPLGDIVRQVTRLFAKYDLDYTQTGYVVKCVRKNLGLAPEQNRKKLQELISPTEADAIIAAAYRQSPLYGLIMSLSNVGRQQRDPTCACPDRVGAGLARARSR